MSVHPQIAVAPPRAHHPASWQVVAALTLITSALVLAGIPRDTWLSTAALSLALGSSSLALMGAAALLAGRWPLVPSALHLELAPVRRPIQFQAGQFGFLRMKEDGLREPHPFTIAGSGPEGHVHFVVRALGDYTSQLVARTTPDMQAEIYAPYGRFTRPTGAAREVWIAGGVGISPFIAWLTDAKAAHLDRVTLFYFFTPGREFPSAAVLEGLARERGVEFVPVSGGPTSPAFEQRLGEIAASEGAAAVQVGFCGPRGLLERVREVMRAKAIPGSNLRYEYFEFR